MMRGKRSLRRCELRSRLPGHAKIALTKRGDQRPQLAVSAYAAERSVFASGSAGVCVLTTVSMNAGRVPRVVRICLVHQVLIPVKALAALEDMNHRNKADLSEVAFPPPRLSPPSSLNLRPAPL